MFRAIMFKEWLKIRWVAAALLAISLILMGSIALTVNRDMTFNSPISVWSAVVFLGYQYYGSLRYLPLLIGLAIAAAQFVPESASGRLSLSLHLPMRENGIMLRMLATGAMVVAALLCLLLLLLWGISAWFFPWEISRAALLSATPWMLAGLAGYAALSAVIVEPRWFQRGFLLLVSAGYVETLFEPSAVGAYAPSIPFFIALGACLAIAVLLSAHRFRRGVR
jgi:hypothetical protein